MGGSLRKLVVLFCVTALLVLSLALPASAEPGDEANCLAKLARYGNTEPDINPGDWPPGTGGKLYVKGYAHDWHGVEEWGQNCYWP